METKLDSEETLALKQLLSNLKIRQRTGELGIIHGMDRFISTNTVFRKDDLKLLDGIAKKLGLQGGLGRTEK